MRRVVLMARSEARNAARSGAPPTVCCCNARAAERVPTRAAPRGSGWRPLQVSQPEPLPWSVARPEQRSPSSRRPASAASQLPPRATPLPQHVPTGPVVSPPSWAPWLLSGCCPRLCAALRSIASSSLAPALVVVTAMWQCQWLVHRVAVAWRGPGQVRGAVRAPMRCARCSTCRAPVSLRPAPQPAGFHQLAAQAGAKETIPIIALAVDS